METKPALKSTEFWAMLAVNLASLLSALAGALPPKWAGLVSTVVTGLYAIGRGLAKQGVKPDK
jgi:hypothetical protein